jgi:hypothetical protein
MSCEKMKKLTTMNTGNTIGNLIPSPGRNLKNISPLFTRERLGRVLDTRLFDELKRFDYNTTASTIRIRLTKKLLFHTFIFFLDVFTSTVSSVSPPIDREKLKINSARGDE